MKRYLLEVDDKATAELNEKSFTLNGQPAFGLSVLANDISMEVLPTDVPLTREDLTKAQEKGQNEAWELAQKILELPSKGGYTPEELIDIFGSDVVPYYDHDLIRRYTFHDVVTKIHEWEEKKAKEFHPGDVVKLHWGGEDNRLAVVTWTKPGSELLGIVLDDGNVGDIVKSQCSKTGKTLNVVSLLCELNGEEE